MNETDAVVQRLHDLLQQESSYQNESSHNSFSRTKTFMFDANALVVNNHDVLYSNTNAEKLPFWRFNPLQSNQLLGEAVKQNLIALVRLLLLQGAVNDSTMFHAVEHGYIDIVKELLLYQPDINMKNWQGYPASVAFQYEKFEICRLLLQSGGKLGSKQMCQKFMVRKLNGKCLHGVSFLLENRPSLMGPLKHMDDCKDWTPLHMAVQSDSVDIVKYIVEKRHMYKDADVINANCSYIYVMKHNKTADSNTENHADTPARSSSPSLQYTRVHGTATPLSLAIQNNNMDIARLLVQNGADIHSKLIVGDDQTTESTPLELACCESYNLDLVYTIVRHHTTAEMSTVVDTTAAKSLSLDESKSFVQMKRDRSSKRRIEEIN